MIGEPLHLSGEQSAWASKVRVLGDELGAFSGLSIYYQDERLTTAEAHQRLYEAGRPRQQHRAVVDQVAAVLILEDFLSGLSGEAGSLS